jgi:hypothetical protein
MKAYTDKKQSKKLAEILPIESADMDCIPSAEDDDDNTLYTAEYKSEVIFDEDCIPCWSIAALLDILPASCDNGCHCLSLINPNPDDKTEWLCAYEDCFGDLMFECYADNSIDACYEMILKLHELKLL